MGMARAFMISFLARQALTRSRQELAGLYPHPWLVWEPGAWTAPSPNNRMTILPPAPGTERPVAGDALCFELSACSLRLGRAAENEIIISDATVSREHLELAVDDAGRWSVTVRGGCETRVDDQSVPVGQPRSLAPGATIKTGRVVLTFLDQAAFLGRVAKAAQGLGA